MNPRELQEWGRAEVSELGGEPLSRRDRELWRAERRGSAILLAGLADWNAEALRRAAISTAGGLNDATRALLQDAADAAEEEVMGSR
jgi:hypothetical protein